jgi:Flp pilus assembly protein TadD
LKINRQDAQANFALVRLYLDDGEFQRSIDAAGKIPVAKRTAALLPILAADYVASNQQDKASVEIRAILELAGQNPDLAPQLAEFFMDHGAFRDASELLKIASTRQKKTDRFLYDEARVQAGLGNRTQARDLLAHLQQASPQYLDALTEAGRLAGLDSDWSTGADLPPAL